MVRKMKRVRRRINNYNILKSYSKAELLGLLPAWYDFRLEPWTHQLACLVATLAEQNFLSCLDLGTGKTKVAVDACRYWRHFKNNLRIFVICLDVAVENWADEIKMNSSMEAVCLRGRTANILDKINGPGFFIINFQSMMRMLSESKETLTPVWRKGEKDFDSDNIQRYDRKTKWRIDNRKIKEMKKISFDVLIIDESHMIKNKDSLTWKLVKRLSDFIDKRLLLTGTPFGNTLLDVWPQYFILDYGKTYLNSLSKYKRRYFEDKGYWGPDWVVTKEGKEEIRKRLFNKAIRYEESEVDDLPEKVYNVVKYDLVKSQSAAYDELVDNDEIYGTEIKNKFTTFMQICSGFIIKSDTTFKSNPKLDLLKEIIQQAVESSKIVIFHEFILECIMIEDMLKKMKIKFNRLNSRVKNKNKEYKTFADDPEYKVMIAHPRSGGASINLVSAAYCAFFSNSGSIINRKQCEKRVHRAGQKSSRVFYYDFVARDTIEQSIRKSLGEGKELFDYMVDDKSYKKIVRGKI